VRHQFGTRLSPWPPWDSLGFGGVDLGGHGLVVFISRDDAGGPFLAHNGTPSSVHFIYCHLKFTM